MTAPRRCRSCRDPIEDGWWLKSAYNLNQQQIFLASQYCEECGREKVLGILEAPGSFGEYSTRPDGRSGMRASSDGEENE